MCCRPESIKSEAFGILGHQQRAIADKPRTQEGSRLKIGITLRDAKAEALIGDSVLCVSSVDVVAGKLGEVAKVLTVGFAIAAPATSPAKPGDPNSLVDGKPCDLLTYLNDRAHNLVTQDQRQLGLV
jgi:hypothetical protein